MKYQDCLSLRELLSIRADPTSADAESSAHLDRCARCGALLSSLEPESSDEIQLELPAELSRLSTNRPSKTHPNAVSAGQIWLATAPGKPDWRYTVVVIGKPKQRPGTIIVAPLFTEIDEATDLDLMLEPELLGYPAAVAVWNYGSVSEHLLSECAAETTPSELETIQALYRHVVGGGARPGGAVGPELGGELDPRRVFRHELIEQLRPLYGPARTSERVEPESANLGQPTLSLILGSVLSQPNWDRQSLMERAKVDTETLELFLHDQLNLTHHRDIDALARTLQTLGITLDQAHEPIMRSLLDYSPGGEVRAESGEFSVAARAESGASSEDVSRDLYAGLGLVDESPASRERAANAYWLALVERYDED